MTNQPAMAGYNPLVAFWIAVCLLALVFAQGVWVVKTFKIFKKLFKRSQGGQTSFWVANWQEGLGPNKHKFTGISLPVQVPAAHFTLLSSSSPIPWVYKWTQSL